MAGASSSFPTAPAGSVFCSPSPSDVPTYVEYGAAALGIVGLDTVREGGHDLYEPLSLGIGRCRLSLAGPASWRGRDLRLRAVPAGGQQVPATGAGLFPAARSVC